MQVQSLGLEDPLEEGMATHSSIKTALPMQGGASSIPGQGSFKCHAV